MSVKLDGLYTPGGRLVMGSTTTKSDKDHDGKPIPPGKQSYFLGVAVPKNAPGCAELIGQLYQMAVSHYGQVPLVMNQISQGLSAKDFSWKIQDGDIPTYDKRTGQPRETPDYMKGCFIFKFSTMFEIDACDVNGAQINRADIKRGDYVDIMFNSQPNGKMDDTAGIYLNPIAIRRLGYGDAISGGVSASEAFSNRAPNVPAGATQMPTAGGATPPAGMPAPQPYQQPAQGGGMPGMNPTQAPAPTQMPAAGQPAQGGGMPGMGQAPAGAPGGSTASGIEPHTGILNGPQGNGGMPGV